MSPSAVADIVNAQIVESRRQLGDDVMVGTLTLHYDRSVPGLQTRLADLQYEHLDEHSADHAPIDQVLASLPTPAAD